jgi:hypothetical protein
MIVKPPYGSGKEADMAKAYVGGFDLTKSAVGEVLKVRPSDLRMVIAKGKELSALTGVVMDRMAKRTFPCCMAGLKGVGRYFYR